jgi:hypothetical protein
MLPPPGTQMIAVGGRNDGATGVVPEKADRYEWTGKEDDPYFYNWTGEFDAEGRAIMVPSSQE